MDVLRIVELDLCRLAVRREQIPANRWLPGTTQVHRHPGCAARFIEGDEEDRMI